MTRPNIPRNKATPAATFTAELKIIVTTPTESIKAPNWSAGRDSERKRETIFLMVRRVNAAMMRVHARNDPVSFVT